MAAIEPTLAADLSATRPSGAAERYAAALLALADDRRRANPDALDLIAADVEALGRLASGDEAFRAFIADPRLDAAAQRRAAFAVLEKAGIPAGTAVHNLVGVLVNNRRLALLPGVVRAFAALLAARRGQQTAEVTTAHGLSDTQRAQITARLTEAGYSGVKLIERTDPSILGGLVVRIGSRLFDSSIKSKLQRLQYAMKGAA
ncbi:ATP synthase F1 subunit delta [Roseomonas sp. NAR14]|uniref:ATP synthase subunit delta n=1 Tax=Roseomonas acroporae TaxID=2937791 RepID=A0A9X1YAP7_9PROT|nr:ATP synthase F1 subunit delta [Roseomonas acroporae]